MPEAEQQKLYPYHRRFVRHKVRLKVQVRAGQSFQTWTHNISEGGTCFEIPECVTVGEDVKVWIYLASTKEETPVEAQARIVWFDRGKKGFRHGAQFLSFVGNGLLLLRTHLAAL